MSKPQTILGLAFPILRLRELAAYPQISWRKIQIELIDPGGGAVYRSTSGLLGGAKQLPSATGRPAQNPLPHRVCIYLNLRGSEVLGSAAHKQMFLRWLRIPTDGRSGGSSLDGRECCQGKLHPVFSCSGNQQRVADALPLHRGGGSKNTGQRQGYRASIAQVLDRDLPTPPQV
jgi:hypothetical protein